MNTSNDLIVSHFKEHFADFQVFNYKKLNSSKFKCCYMESCNINFDKEAAYTSALGDPDSQIMLVAESPSTTNGSGCFVSGFSADVLQKKKNDNLFHLIEYIKTINDGKLPYFTDVVKCGLQRTSEKGLLAKRATYCITKFLQYEINCLHPKLIICLGRFSFENVTKIRSSFDFEFEVVQITHYSNRASLTLAIEDKIKVIWPLELRKFKDKTEGKNAVLNLKHIRRKLERLYDETGYTAPGRTSFCRPCQVQDAHLFFG